MKQQTIKKSIKNFIKEAHLFEPNYTLDNHLPIKRNISTTFVAFLTNFLVETQPLNTSVAFILTNLTKKEVIRNAKNIQ